MKREYYLAKNTYILIVDERGLNTLLINILSYQQPQKFIYFSFLFRGFTDSMAAFYIYIDVGRDLVASGSEDCTGRIWDR